MWNSFQKLAIRQLGKVIPERKETSEVSLTISSWLQCTQYEPPKARSYHRPEKQSSEFR
jgi:hypothetical protein